MIDRDIHIPCLLCPTCFSGTLIHSYSVSKFNAVVFAKEVFTVRLLHHGHPINNNNNNNNNNNSSSGSNSNKGTGQNNYTRTGLTFRGGGGGVLRDTTYLRTFPTTFYWLSNLSWHRNIQLARVSIK